MKMLEGVTIPARFAYFKEGNYIGCYGGTDISLEVIYNWFTMHFPEDIISQLYRGLKIRLLAKLLSVVLGWDFDRPIYPVGIYNFQSTYDLIHPQHALHGENIWTVVGSLTRGFIIEEDLEGSNYHALSIISQKYTRIYWYSDEEEFKEDALWFESTIKQINFEIPASDIWYFRWLEKLRERIL